MKIAITGTVGSGKSTVSLILREMGYHVFDCDEDNARLLQEGHRGFRQVEKHFPEVITDGHIDKTKLAQIIFRDKEKKKLLEDLMHPLILSDMFEEAKQYPLFFAEVPLLFENDLEKYFDVSVLVVLSEEKALKRLVLRGMELEDAKRRIASQLPAEEKMKRADKIIYNEGSLEDLTLAVEQLVKELC